MRYLWIGALVLAMGPAIAMADRGSRYDGGGRHYDRGERYHGRSGSSFGFSFGFGSSGYRGRDYSYSDIRFSTGRPSYGYSRGYDRVYTRSYYEPRYCPPA